MLTGSITQVNTNFFNGDPKTGAVLPQGSTELREFAQNDYELYVEDAWRVRNNVTLTLGLRYQYSTPPWETNGFQSAVNLDIHQWLSQREINQLAGVPSDASPLLSWPCQWQAILVSAEQEGLRTSASFGVESWIPGWFVEGDIRWARQEFTTSRRRYVL